MLSTTRATPGGSRWQTQAVQDLQKNESNASYVSCAPNRDQAWKNSPHGWGKPGFEFLLPPCAVMKRDEPRRSLSPTSKACVAPLERRRPASLHRTWLEFSRPREKRSVASLKSGRSSWTRRLPTTLAGVAHRTRPDPPHEPESLRRRFLSAISEYSDLEVEQSPMCEHAS